MAKSRISHYVLERDCIPLLFAGLWTDIGATMSFLLALAWWQWCISRSLAPARQPWHSTL